MAPSASQKKEFPILSLVGVVLVLVLVAAGFWAHYLVETNRKADSAIHVKHSGSAETHYTALAEREADKAKRDVCFQGAVVGLLLILVLISARGHIFRPMHM